MVAKMKCQSTASGEDGLRPEAGLEDPQEDAARIRNRPDCIQVYGQGWRELMYVISVYLLIIALLAFLGAVVFGLTVLGLIAEQGAKRLTGWPRHAWSRTVHPGAQEGDSSHLLPDKTPQHSG